MARCCPLRAGNGWSSHALCRKFRGENPLGRRRTRRAPAVDHGIGMAVASLVSLAADAKRKLSHHCVGQSRSRPERGASRSVFHHADGRRCRGGAERSARQCRSRFWCVDGRDDRAGVRAAISKKSTLADSGLYRGGRSAGGARGAGSATGADDARTGSRPVCRSRSTSSWSARHRSPRRRSRSTPGSRCRVADRRACAGPRRPPWGRWHRAP